MSYKIGDKVEYLNNVWEVCDWEDDSIEIYNEKLGVNIYVHVGDVKPYQSAHDKLIALGWEEINTTIQNNKRYDKDDDTIYFDMAFRNYEIYHKEDVGCVGIELSRILTQYLEEIVE